MTPCLIKNNNAFTLVEMMIAVGFSVVLMTGVYGFYNASSQAYSSGISGQNLQDGANIILSKIIEGETESNVVYRLATSASYMVPNGVGTALYTCGSGTKVAPCNTSNTSGELYYCQDSLCSTGDATARWYYLNSTGTSVIYHHPKTGGGTTEETIYAAPTGSSINLRFSPAQNNGVVIPNVLEVDVDLAKNLSPTITNARLATSGGASTFVLMRNHS
jgi:hypothetical protein